jgi:hypothetical protein
MGITREVEMNSVSLITDIDPALPPQLGRLIARGLSTDPAGRIQSATDFAEELTIQNSFPRFQRLSVHDCSLEDPDAS